MTTTTDLAKLNTDALQAERDRLEAEYIPLTRTITVSAPLELRQPRERHMHELALRVAEIDVELGQRWIANRDAKVAELQQQAIETPELLEARQALEAAQRAYDVLAMSQQAAQSEVQMVAMEARSARKRLGDLRSMLRMRQEALERLETNQSVQTMRQRSRQHAYDERRAEVQRMETRCG